MIFLSILIVFISGSPYRGLKEAIDASVRGIYDTFIVRELCMKTDSNLIEGVKYLNRLKELVAKRLLNYLKTSNY